MTKRSGFTFRRLIASVLGDIELTSIENFSFNLMCLIFGILCAFFAFENSSAGNSPILFWTEVGIIIVAGIFYYFGRFRRVFRPLVPILWLICPITNAPVWFLQGGSIGSATYVIFPALLGLLIITKDKRKYWMVIAASLYVAALLAIEFIHPDWIIQYPTREDRFLDVAVTFIPCVIVFGIFVSMYVTNYGITYGGLQIQKRKIDLLTSMLRRYLPSQLVASIESGQRQPETRPERKRITVFFSDIKDFTLTTDSMEPEDLTALLNEYLTEMTEIACKWGGTIDKFIGDAMMVLFGVPLSEGEKEDAMRCVRMGMEMQGRMKNLKTKWYEMGIEMPMQIRVGINTGMAAVGDFGTKDRLSYTAIGGEVNLASRLQGLSETGGIVISHSTWALVKDEIACERRAEKAIVKGIGRELTIYDVKLCT